MEIVQNAMGRMVGKPRKNPSISVAHYYLKLELPHSLLFRALNNSACSLKDDARKESIMTSVSPKPPAASTTGAPSQAGVLDGMNPSHYNPSNPLTLFIIQVGLPVVNLEY